MCLLRSSVVSAWWIAQIKPRTFGQQAFSTVDIVSCTDRKSMDAVNRIKNDSASHKKQCFVRFGIWTVKVKLKCKLIFTFEACLNSTAESRWSKCCLVKLQKLNQLLDDISENLDKNKLFSKVQIMHSKDYQMQSITHLILQHWTVISVRPLFYF